MFLMRRVLSLFVVMMCLCAATIGSTARPPAALAQGTQPPGDRPLIFIRSFRTEPAVVEAAQTFRLYLELHNVGAAGAGNIVISISSDSFVPQGSSSVKTIGGLDVNEHGWVWQDLRSNPDLAGGTYAVTIGLTYQDANGYPFTSNETVGVNVAAAAPTPTPTTAPKPGIPQLVIEQVTTLPDRAAAGVPFTLTFTLRNTGSGAARRVLATVGADNKNFAPTTGSNVSSVGDIGIGKSQNVAMRLVADSDTTSGLHTLQLTLDFINWGDEKFTSTQTVAVQVTGNPDAAQTPVPQALPIIESYTSDPLRPSPGQPLNLRLNLRNAGSATARRLTITFGTASSGGTSSSTIFAPLGTGNVRVVPPLAADDLIAVDMQFIVSGSAAAGTYVVPIDFSYDGPDGKPVERTEQITLLVSVAPQLRVDFYRPVGQPLPGTTFDLPVEVINQGRSSVAIGAVDVAAAPGLDVQNGSAYVGALDAGQSGTVDAQGVAQAGGLYSVTVTIHYVDDFNQNQAYTATLPVEVLSMVEPGGPGGPVVPGEPETPGVQRPFVERLLRGLFGLGSG